MDPPVTQCLGEPRHPSASGERSAAVGGAGAQRMAIDSANKKCDALGKTITVTNVDTGHEFPAAGRAIVTFTCT